MSFFANNQYIMVSNLTFQLIIFIQFLWVMLRDVRLLISNQRFNICNTSSIL